MNLTFELALTILGTIFTLIAGAWALLTLAGRSWSRRQEMQFEILNKNLEILYSRVELYHNDSVRLELKLSESEKLALKTFALDQELKIIRHDFDERIMSTLSEIRATGIRIDKLLETFSGFMSRTTDHRG